MKHLSSLNKYFSKYKKLFLFGILFTLLSNYFRILSPQVSKFIIDKVTTVLNNNQSSFNTIHYNFIVRYFIEFFSNKSVTTLIVYSGVGLLLLAILGGLFMFLMRQTIIVMSRHIEFDQKNEIFSHYQKLDTEFYKVHSTGDLMNRISEDVSKVRMYTGPSVMYIINLFGTIGFSLYFMFKENFLLSLYVIAPLPVLVLIIYFVNNIINKKSEEVQSNLSDLTTIAQESYSGIRVIKSFVQEKNSQNLFEEKSKKYQLNATSLSKVEALYFPSIALLIGLSTLITIVMGCLMHIKNPQIVTAGTIAEFVIYINMLTFPVSAIGFTASMVQRAAASQKRINEFLKIAPTVYAKNLKQSVEVDVDNLLKNKMSIEFKNVSFTYNHSNIKALKNINFSLKNGEKILVLGKTGSGKTSLVTLILKFYQQQTGSIFYNEIDGCEVDSKLIRKNISYVPQDVFLFSDSIKENILFGANINTSQEEIERIATIASVEKEIKSFDKNYETIVGERGVTLSGGQKQRISISRALSKNASLYIFDDCFSAIDNITEKRIGESLTQFLYQKSALFISHRIFSEFKFDKIIVLDNGNIIEEGTHESLLRKNGYYTKLYNTQIINTISNN